MSDLDAARSMEPGDALRVIEKALRSKTNTEVGRAATTAAELRLYDAVPALEEAYRRLAAKPASLDRGCFAMTAIVSALGDLQADAEDVFLHAARHVQMELVDAAADLRRAALLALVRANSPAALPIATDQLADPEDGVRVNAARTLRAIGTEAAVLLLRLLLRRGEADPEIASECFAGLLEYGSDALDVVSEYVLGDNEVLASLAALAIAEARPPGALDVLRRAWEQHRQPELRDVILDTIASLRSDEGVDFLIGLVGRDYVTAVQALQTLTLYAADSNVVRRIESAAKGNSRPEVLATFRRLYR